MAVSSSLNYYFLYMGSVRTASGSALFDTTPLPLDPQYHGWILILICAICLPLLLFFVALRLYVRIWIPQSFALDDGKDV